MVGVCDVPGIAGAFPLSCFCRGESSPGGVVIWRGPAELIEGWLWKRTNMW